MPLSRISQKQILARVALNGTDGSATDAGDFIVQNTSADENDNILLEENTDLEIFVDNIQQEPTTAYSVSGTTLHSQKHHQQEQIMFTL